VKPAVLLDRDGTIIEQVHHLTDPAGVKLIPGAGEAIRTLRAHGYVCVVVTNQSVIGRGMLTVEGLERVHREMHRQLAEHRARLDGVYFCPVAPTSNDRTAVEHCDRKPGPGMLWRAARELDLELGRSWFVGDMLSDLHAGRNAGCRGSILVRTGRGASVSADDPVIDHVVEDLLEGARLIIRLDAPAKSDTAACEALQARRPR